jgi:hypothetical protein
MPLEFTGFPRMLFGKDEHMMTRRDVSRRTFIGTTLAMTTLAAAEYRTIDSHVHTWKHDPEFPFAHGANVLARDAAPETLRST